MGYALVVINSKLTKEKTSLAQTSFADNCSTLKEHNKVLFSELGSLFCYLQIAYAKGLA